MDDQVTLLRGCWAALHILDYTYHRLRGSLPESLPFDHGRGRWVLHFRSHSYCIFILIGFFQDLDGRYRLAHADRRHSEMGRTMRRSGIDQLRSL